jgi:hypothetical protein
MLHLIAPNDTRLQPTADMVEFAHHRRIREEQKPLYVATGHHPRHKGEGIHEQATGIGQGSIQALVRYFYQAPSEQGGRFEIDPGIAPQMCPMDCKRMVGSIHVASHAL